MSITASNRNAEAPVPSWRLREEADKRRELEHQCKAFRIALRALGCDPDENLAEANKP